MKSRRHELNELVNSPIKIKNYGLLDNSPERMPLCKANNSGNNKDFLLIQRQSDPNNVPSYTRTRISPKIDNNSNNYKINQTFDRSPRENMGTVDGMNKVSDTIDPG